MSPKAIHAQSPRAVNRLARLAGLVVVSIALLSSLSGCGKRPGAVDPPPGAQDMYKHYTYPNPATDPLPAAQGAEQPTRGGE